MQVRYGWLRQGLAWLFALMLGIVLAEPASAQEAAVGEANAPDAVSVVVSGQVRLGNSGEAGVIVEALSILNDEVIASTITDSQGRYSLDMAIQAFHIVPRKGVFEFTPASNIILLATNNITLNYAMTRPPILIMGGYTPMGIPQSKCPQFRLNNTSYNPGACGEDEFADLLFDLRSKGWNVRTVMMDSSILGTPSLANQTSALRANINLLRAVTGASKVIVFAHGTGGPVVRRYMESRLYAGDVSHFFSFGSEHVGNPVESIADEWFAQIMPAYLRATGIVPDSLISFMVMVIGNTINDKVNFLCTTTHRTYTTFFGTFSIPGPGQTVLCETSVSGMANFNQSFRPKAGVRYHLVHARSVRLSDMNALGLAMTAAIPGLDDTLINTNNINLLNGPHDRLLTRDPHMTMTSVGERYYLNTNGAFDSAYVRCIRPMFITRTLSEPNCGIFVTGAREGERVFSAEEESAALAAITAAEEGATEQKISLRTGNLPDTTTLITHTIPLFEGGSATFLANWITDTVDFSVVDPLGTVYTATSVDANVEYAGDDSRASYVFTSTLTGDYTIQLQATEVITGGVDVSYYAAFESEYTLTTTRSRNWMPPGGAITITALFTGPTPIANPQVEAILSGSSGVTGTVSLSPVGDGRFVYVYTAPDAPGYLEMAIVATGEVNNVPIERSDDLSFTIYPDSFRPSGVYTESVNFAGLTVDVGILVTPGASGDFRVTGILVDGEGNFIAVATADATAPEDATAMSVSLLFDGAELYAAGDEGPFLVRRLLVIDEREHQQVSADEFDVYTTSAVDLMQFAPERIYLPSVMQ
jgi:hypothetical protein